LKIKFCAIFILVFLISALLLLSKYFDEDTITPETYTWETMRTVINISLCCDDKKRQNALFDEI
jgi:hypothetical protein